MQNIERWRVQIEDQFPEFYREEFPQFILFVKKYYEFLEKNTNYNKFKKPKDIDDSFNDFAVELKSEFAKNIPTFDLFDDKFFLNHAKNFYVSRGSEDSYHFLFRALFGKEIEISYPSEIVLKTSDGEWNQEISIRVRSNQDLSILAGKDFDIINSFNRKINLKCERAARLKNDLFDVFISRNYTGTINLGDTIQTTDDVDETKNVNGTIVSMLSDVEIEKPGKGFSKGQFFVIPDPQNPTFPIRIKIIGVDKAGGITSATIISPGASDIVRWAILDKKNNTALKSNFQQYSPQDYAADNIWCDDLYSEGSEFSTASHQAKIKIKQGHILKYPGFFSSSKGFLSDAIKIRDNHFYQAYSYVLKLDEQIAKYRDIVKKLLHPAGMELFGQFDITTKIYSKSKYITGPVTHSVVFDDAAELNDNTYNFKFVKSLQETLDPQLEQIKFSVKTSASDVINTADSGYAVLQKFINDFIDPEYFDEDYTKTYVPQPPVGF
jgi:hypothetical protein